MCSAERGPCPLPVPAGEFNSLEVPTSRGLLRTSTETPRVSLVVHQKYAGFFMGLEDLNGSNRELFLEALYQSFIARANTPEFV